MKTRSAGYISFFACRNILKAVPAVIFLFFYISGGTGGNAFALELDFEGQLSGWTVESKVENRWKNSSGIRYIPGLKLSRDTGSGNAFDSELYINSFAASGPGTTGDNSDIDLYRANFRYTTTRSETSIGLQKINFGPAFVLRSLKWFDRLDPSDPLKLTEGVYGIRFRYDAPDNSGCLAWVLYGNDETKGYEILPSTSENIEAGGRIQRPLLSGDMAFTVHTRKVDGKSFHLPDFRETRYAVDGRWDMKVGLWFETVLQEQDSRINQYRWTKMITLGVDYTFDLGAGLYFLTEHMTTGGSEKIVGFEGENLHTSAVQMSMPIGILDSISAIGYYSWENNRYSQYINWTRTYDNFQINAGFYYFPEAASYNYGMAGSRGIRIMLIFNH